VNNSNYNVIAACVVEGTRPEQAISWYMYMV
jgi:hypothetical protein